MARDTCCAAARPGWVESVLGMGTRVWGRGGGYAPLVTGPGNPGGVKNTIYFLFLSKADGILEMGQEEPAVWPWLPCIKRGPGQLPTPFALGPGGRPPLSGPERWPGGSGGGQHP